MAQVIPSLPRVLAFVWASGGDDLGYQVVKGIGDAIWCHGCIVVTSNNMAEAAKNGGKKKMLTTGSFFSDKKNACNCFFM
jgi:hypothetical protein